MPQFNQTRVQQVVKAAIKLQTCTSTGRSFISHGNSPFRQWVTMSRKPRRHSPPEEQVKRQQEEQDQEIQPEVSFPEEERLVAATVVIATATAVIAQRLCPLEGSVWDQKAIPYIKYRAADTACMLKHKEITSVHTNKVPEIQISKL